MSSADQYSANQNFPIDPQTMNGGNISDVHTNPFFEDGIEDEGTQYLTGTSTVYSANQRVGYGGHGGAEHVETATNACTC